MLLWSLMIFTFILCAISSFPTKWCADLWSWMAALWHGHVVRQLEREMARKTAGTGFSAAVSFLPRGVGLALDPARKLLFLAADDGGGVRSALLPFTALRAARTGEGSDRGFYDHYVDIDVQDEQHPLWRLLCGEKPELAAAVRQALREQPGI